MSFNYHEFNYSQVNSLRSAENPVAKLSVFFDSPPYSFVKIKSDGVTSGLNDCDEPTCERRACKKIGDRKGNTEVEYAKT